MGKAGFMFGWNYRPFKSQEVQEFTNADKYQVSDSTRLANGNYAQLSQKGPIRFLISFDSVPAGGLWVIGQLYLLDDTIWDQISTGPDAAEFIVRQFGVDSKSLLTRHIVITSLENCLPDTSFEFQSVIHMEGPPTSAS